MIISFLTIEIYNGMYIVEYPKLQNLIRKFIIFYRSSTCKLYLNIRTESIAIFKNIFVNISVYM